MAKVKDKVAGKQLCELMSYGTLSFEDFRHMMDNVCEGCLSDQEVITLAR